MIAPGIGDAMLAAARSRYPSVAPTFPGVPRNDLGGFDLILGFLPRIPALGVADRIGGGGALPVGRPLGREEATRQNLAGAPG